MHVVAASNVDESQYTAMDQGEQQELVIQAVGWFYNYIGELAGFTDSQISSVSISWNGVPKRARQRRTIPATITFTFDESVSMEVAIEAAAALQKYLNSAVAADAAITSGVSTMTFSAVEQLDVAAVSADDAATAVAAAAAAAAAAATPGSIGGKGGKEAAKFGKVAKGKKAKKAKKGAKSKKAKAGKKANKKDAKDLKAAKKHPKKGEKVSGSQKQGSGGGVRQQGWQLHGLVAALAGTGTLVLFASFHFHQQKKESKARDRALGTGGKYGGQNYGDRSVVGLGGLGSLAAGVTDEPQMDALAHLSPRRRTPGRIRGANTDTPERVALL